jgi:short-subunit dehydrogenase
MNFSERKIVMTGASSGIGRCVAELLLKQGATLVTISRSADGPQNAKHLRADLSTADGIDAACAIVVGESPDVLINLAGIQYCGPFGEQSSLDIFNAYMVNLVAPVTLCRSALPAMRRRGDGQVVNIGSIFGSIGFAHFAAYSSAKAGLRSFSEALRRELIDTGIAVTYIAPRAVKTPAITARIQKYAQLTRMVIDQPEHIAALIVAAILLRKKDVYFGFPESLFIRLNAVIPRFFDHVLAVNDRKAKRLFAYRDSISERLL